MWQGFEKIGLQTTAKECLKKLDVKQYGRSLLHRGDHKQAKNQNNVN